MLFDDASPSKSTANLVTSLRSSARVRSGVTQSGIVIPLIAGDFAKSVGDQVTWRRHR